VYCCRIADYAQQIVDDEVWVDVPKVWNNFALVIVSSVMCDVKHFDGRRPQLDDFIAAYEAAQNDTRQPHILLVTVLRLLVSH
jgi:hypothetical protein